MYERIILKDCMDTELRLAAGTPENTCEVCFCYFGGRWQTRRDSFHPAQGHGGVAAAGCGHITDRMFRAAVDMIPTAFTLSGQKE